MAGIVQKIASPLNAAKDILQEALRVQGVLKHGNEIRDLHEKVLAGIDELSAKQAEIEALKREVTDLKAHKTQHERYELQRLEPGVFVMALKADVQPPEPAHYACEKCFGDGKIRRLQKQPRERNGLSIFVCTGCSTELEVGHYVRPQPVQTRRYNPLRRRS